jgi:two-component system cell cycle response regulator
VRIQAAATQGTKLSILMMDLDGLKRVNDSHGHQAGAFIISEAGKLIGSICNHNGQACRYGGDEFIAYLLDPLEEAIDTAERIRKAVSEHVFSKDGLDLRVSISIGVAVFPEDGKSLEALTKAADEALYRAKGKGRNVVSG